MKIFFGSSLMTLFLVYAWMYSLTLFSYLALGYGGSAASDKYEPLVWVTYVLGLTGTLYYLSTKKPGYISFGYGVAFAVLFTVLQQNGWFLIYL